MLKIAAFTLLIPLLIVTGCGYKIVLTGTKAAFTIHPEKLENSSDDIGITSQFKDSVNLYLSTINALAEKGEADYTGSFTLIKLRDTGSSDTSKTTTAYINIGIKIKLSNKQGESVLSKNYFATENYSNTTSQSETRSNRSDAFDEAVNRAMTDFRNDVERE